VPVLSEVSGKHGAGKQRHYYITSTTSIRRHIVVALLACAMLTSLYRSTLQQPCFSDLQIGTFATSLFSDLQIGTFATGDSWKMLKRKASPCVRGQEVGVVGEDGRAWWARLF
jgi:hypothetical protein